MQLSPFEHSKVLTQDALRMRLKRLCEKKAKSKKCHVDDQTHEQYSAGGPQREWLEMALLEALQTVGPEACARGKTSHNQVLAPSLHAELYHIHRHTDLVVILVFVDCPGKLQSKGDTGSREDGSQRVRKQRRVADRREDAEVRRVLQAARLNISHVNP